MATVDCDWDVLRISNPGRRVDYIYDRAEADVEADLKETCELFLGECFSKTLSDENRLYLLSGIAACVGGNTASKVLDDLASGNLTV